MAGVDKVHLLIHLSAYPPTLLMSYGTSPHHLFLSHHVSPVPPSISLCLTPPLTP